MGSDSPVSEGMQLSLSCPRREQTLTLVSAQVLAGCGNVTDLAALDDESTFAGPVGMLDIQCLESEDEFNRNAFTMQFELLCE